MTKLLLSFSAFLFPLFLMAQTVSGIVTDADSNTPLEGILVNADADQMSATTGANGKFALKLKNSGTLTFTAENYKELTVSYTLQGADIDLGTITLSSAGADTQEDLIPTLLLNEVQADAEGASLSDNISGLLTASRDPFLSEASFSLGQYRFRVRGYDSEHGTLMMNGVPMNELENGRIFWNVWSGLNDVLRNRDIEIGLAPAEMAFGGVNGTQSIDTRASSQRAQTRVSYAISNRSYRNRVMVTHSSGLNRKGWAYSLSASRRWADEGYIEGTVFDGYSYFASIDKKFNNKHLLNLTAFGAPTKRGRIGLATEEMREIVGDNYYNPNWGYQDGEKRNSRIQNIHQPVGILRHDWKMTPNSELTTSVSYQTGRNGQTRLDWFNRADPRPNYYRYLPSFLAFGENASAETVAERLQFLRDNPDLMQLNFDAFYEENKAYKATVEDVDGIEGNDVTGSWSRVMIEEQRFDSDEFNFASNYRNSINDNWTLYLGARFQSYVGHNFKVVDDLLGGDFTVDIDRFADREIVDDPEAFQQSDLNNPNRLVREGDTFGWNYDIHIRKGGEWGQLRYEGNHWDLFVAGEFETTQIWRDGIYRNGRFPDNSEGESEKMTFLNYGLKGGLTYKIDGRNYLYANAAFETNAPFARIAFVSPRTRNQITPNLESEKILSYEAGYNLRAPKFKGRLTAYYSRFEDQTRRIGFYDDARRTFGNLILQNIDRTHAGVEAALEVQVTSELSLTGVAAIGQNIYSSNQKATIYLDTDDTFSTLFSDNGFNVYSDGFYVANGPQEAYTFKVGYRGKGFWFANLNFNYFDKIFTDFSPVRRTENAVFGLDPTSDTYKTIVEQEQLPSQYTLDFFGGKSFKFDFLKEDLFLYINVGVSNILDNTDFRTGGFEQLRFNYATRDPQNFPPNYFYSFGRTYFVSATFKI